MNPLRRHKATPPASAGDTTAAAEAAGPGWSLPEEASAGNGSIQAPSPPFKAYSLHTATTGPSSSNINTTTTTTTTMTNSGESPHCRVLQSTRSASRDDPFTDLMNQPETVFDRLKDGFQQAKNLRSFYSDLAAIEQTYCKSLLKLVNTSLFAAGESLQTSLHGIRQLVEDSAQVRLAWTRELTSGLTSDLSLLADDLKKERSQMTSAFADAKKSLDKRMASVEKAQGRYVQSVLDVEREVTSRNEARERGLSHKQMAKYSKKVAGALQNHQHRKAAYEAAREEYNLETVEFERSAKYIFQNMEATDMARLQKMQTSLSQFQSTVSQLLTNLEAPLATFKTTVDNINPSSDLEMFVKMNRSGDSTLPHPLSFVEHPSAILDHELSCAALEGAAENTMAIPEVPESSWRSAKARTDEDARDGLPYADTSDVADDELPPYFHQTEPSNDEEQRRDARSFQQVLTALNAGASSSSSSSSSSSRVEPQPSSAPAGAASSFVPPPPPIEPAPVAAGLSGEASQCSGESLPHQHRFVRTMYEYHEFVEDCLEFGVGDYIMVTESVDENWSRGRLNGREAMFPKDFTVPQEVARAKVLYDFVGNSSLELSLGEGQQCWVLDSDDPHWFWGCDDAGNQGNFPKSYCDM